MENKEQLFLLVQNLRTQGAKAQKRGLHFILTSVIIWAAILVIHSSALPLQTKNLYTFFCSAPLMPLAYLISKFIKVDFQNKENPLTNLGILFSVNQMLYLLIAMWVFASVPNKMLMVYAMIFGAHLLPYGWLYQSKTYYILAVFISIAALWLGLNYTTTVLAVFMLLVEIIFCVCLIVENKRSIITL